MKLDELLAILGGLAPEESALSGDPVGLLIEPVSTEIRSVIVCLDATAHVAEAAKESGADLIVAHHPLIYHPIKRMERTDPISSVVISLVERGIGLYAMHTNWDAAEQGINDTLAALLGLDGVRRLGDANEARLARIGSLKRALSANEFLGDVAARLQCSGTSALRYPNPTGPEKRIKTVAVCGGAGASLAAEAIAAGADAFVTADVRHHEFIDAVARGLLLIDAGHEATEAPGMRTLARILAEKALDIRVEFCPNWN